MNFTYASYEGLINLLFTHGYVNSFYENCQDYERSVVLRHDIDYDPQKAFEMAEVENNMGVRSTYFVLLTSDFYNVYSEKTGYVLKKIYEMGHRIGLHFDEKRYGSQYKGAEFLKDTIVKEAEALGSAIGIKINSVSMHRPSKEILEEDLEIPGVINSYSKEFFEEFKYLSDSRRTWREPVEEIVSSEKFKRLQILTHAFWYNKNQMSLEESIRYFVKKGNKNRYDMLDENFTDLKSIMRREEVN